MDFSAGNIPIDIIVFGLIAGFLILRLRSVLGKKTGFEKKDDTPISVSPTHFLPNHKIVQPSKVVEPPKAKVDFVIPAPTTPVGEALQKIGQVDSSFNVTKFLEGSEFVFRKILTAFAAGDLKTLETFLTMDAYTAFKAAIDARNEQQEVQKIEIRQIHSISITKAELLTEGMTENAQIEVKFISDQVNCKFDKDKNPVVGTESVTEFIDFWVFERLLNRNGQGVSWRLKSARSGQ